MGIPNRVGKPKRRVKKDKTPFGNRGYDATGRVESSADANDKKWRRRERNPSADAAKSEPANDLGKQSGSMTVFRQCLSDVTGQPPSSLDADLIKVARCWNELPPANAVGTDYGWFPEVEALLRENRRTKRYT